MSKKNRSKRVYDEELNTTTKSRNGKKARKADADEMKAIANADKSIPKAPPKARDQTPIQGKTKKQEQMLEFMKRLPFTFAVGPAGTGKTYVGAGLACDMLIAGTLDQLVITRPVETVDEELGFTTGDLMEKFAVHLEPYWDVFYDRLGPKLTDYFIKQGRIIPAPLGTMRGRTFKNSVVILDEAQNTTKRQMKMFLTRLGEGSRMIINGDLTQCDLSRDAGISGLRDAMKRFKSNKNFGFVQFEAKDSVRHGMLKEVLDAYDDETID